MALQSPPYVVSAEGRKKAEMVFLELRKTQLPYEICKSILGKCRAAGWCSGITWGAHLLQSTATLNTYSFKLPQPSKKELSESGTFCRL